MQVDFYVYFVSIIYTCKPDFPVLIIKESLLVVGRNNY